MDTTATIGWGIAGTGCIARTVLKDFAHVPGARICAIASRSAARTELPDPNRDFQTNTIPMST